MSDTMKRLREAMEVYRSHYGSGVGIDVFDAIVDHIAAQGPMPGAQGPNLSETPNGSPLRWGCRVEGPNAVGEYAIVSPSGQYHWSWAWEEWQRRENNLYYGYFQRQDEVANAVATLTIPPPDYREERPAKALLDRIAANDHDRAEMKPAPPATPAGEWTLDRALTLLDNFADAEIVAKARAQLAALRAEVDRLCADEESARLARSALAEDIAKRDDRIASLEAEVARLREALEFYGNRANWTNPMQVNQDELFGTAMSSDLHGSRARAALTAPAEKEVDRVGHGWGGSTEPRPDDPGSIEDGFGSSWSRCGKDCSLHVVRPGKSQCNEDGVNCPSKEPNRA